MEIMSGSLLHPFMCFHLGRLTSPLLHHLICLYFFFQINRFDNESKLALRGTLTEDELPGERQERGAKKLISGLSDEIFRNLHVLVS